MTAAATLDLVRKALAGGYAVPAFNVFDDFSMRAVLRAAEEARSPVIVQVSVKTVRALGAPYLRATFLDRAAAVSIPAALHLDHCPSRTVISEVLQAGFDSLLFDASGLGYDDALRQTREVVAEASPRGAAVESEIEGIRGVEDGVGSDEEGARYPVAQLAAFIAETGVDLFAPAIGTAHGRYAAAPQLDPTRVSALTNAAGIPLVLHGGTGLTAAQFRDLVSRGCAKVNVSTAIKEAYLKAGMGQLAEAGREDRWDPPRFFAAAEDAVAAAAAEHIALLGAVGKAA